MKSSYLRAGVALACALGLAACGGSGNDVVLGGSVSGVTQEGLVLQNNGGSDLAVPPGAIMFAFQAMIGGDSSYNVTVKSSPPNASCTVQNGQGKASGFSVNTVVVTCTIFQHALSGTVTGLTAGGLVVVNGSDKVAIDAAGPFTMAKVQEGAPYGITILTQPAGQTCSVANGVGTMGKTDVNNVQISCVPAA